MGSLYKRGGNLWLRFKLGGKWVGRKTDLKPGQEREAQRLLEKVEARTSGDPILADGVTGPVTLARYARKWLERREGIVRTVSDDEARLRLHVLPHLGAMKLDEVRPRHVRDLVRDLRRTELAPKTIRNIHATLRSLFEDALVDELVDENPCTLRRGTLPAKQDKDPAWRATAVYAREELVALISDPRLLPDRRVVYALKGLAGLRHGEVAGLHWKRYDAARQPLGCLTVANSYTRVGTKTGDARAVPVHPTLAGMLDAWRTTGWEMTYGRPPGDDDLIVPTRGFQMRNKKDAWEALKHDLELLGLRHRRGHDLRRTFISLAQDDGAQPHVIKMITHARQADVFTGYTTLQWTTLCTEIRRLAVGLATDLLPSAGTNLEHLVIAANSAVTPPGIEPGSST